MNAKEKMKFYPPVYAEVRSDISIIGTAFSCIVILIKTCHCFGKPFSSKNTPTNPQLKIVLIGEDYGFKVSIRKNKGRAISEPYLSSLKTEYCLDNTIKRVPVFLFLLGNQGILSFVYLSIIFLCGTQLVDVPLP